MVNGILGDRQLRMLTVCPSFKVSLNHVADLLLSDPEYGAPHRVSTTSEPFLLIPKALHHYDENGRFPNETTPSLPPPSVKKAQAEEHEFVKAWVAEWHDEQAKKSKL
jgi:hypothetical protein